MTCEWVCLYISLNILDIFYVSCLHLEEENSINQSINMSLSIHNEWLTLNCVIIIHKASVLRVIFMGDPGNVLSIVRWKALLGTAGEH